jgi:hypothetical protein
MSDIFDSFDLLNEYNKEIIISEPSFLEDLLVDKGESLSDPDLNSLNFKGTEPFTSLIHLNEANRQGNNIGVQNKNWKLVTTTIKNFNFNRDVFLCFKPNKKNENFQFGHLYSSLIYVFEQKVTCCTNDENLFAKYSVVYSESNEEVQRNGKSVLQVNGSLDNVVPLKKISDNVFQAKTKLKFDDNSYNHKKRLFSIVVSYFISSDLINPIVVLVSDKLFVKARKNSVNENKSLASKKSKTQTLNNSENVIQPKMKILKRKVTDIDIDEKNKTQKIEKLYDEYAHLNESEKILFIQRIFSENNDQFDFNLIN